MNWFGHVGRIGMKKGGEKEARKTENGKTALREIWKEWEENGEQQQNIEGVGDC